MCSETKTNKSDNNDLLFFLHKHFVILKRFSEEIYDEAVKNNNDRDKDTYPILHGIVSNIHSIALLTEENKCNDAFIIARALVERLITYLYLQCCSQDEYKNYIAHSQQKSYRKLNQSLKVNDKEFIIKSNLEVDFELNKKLKEHIEQFTGKKGGEITRWSKTNIVNKLETIEKNNLLSDKHFATLMMAFNSIYEDASEALHSTLYGCLFHYGGVIPGSSISTDVDYETEPRNIMRHLMFYTALLANMTIVYVGTKLNVKDAEKNMHEIGLQLLTAVSNNDS